MSGNCFLYGHVLIRYNGGIWRFVRGDWDLPWVSLKFWTKLLHVLLPTGHLNIDLLRKRADLKVDATESRKSAGNRRKELNPYPPYPTIAFFSCRPSRPRPGHGHPATWRLGGGYKHIGDILGAYGTYYLDTELTVCHLADLLGQHLARLRKWLTALT